MKSDQELTERQSRELEYHRERAKTFEHLADQPTSYDVVRSSDRRWWNPYWAMFSYLRTLDLRDKQVLVIGCGFGEDSMRIAMLGGIVSAFDLSPESVAIARRRARRDSLNIDFCVAPAESMPYESDRFDVVFAHDILHHCDVARTTDEMKRVIKAGGLLIVSEVYSHSITEAVRRSALVTRVLYPLLRRMIYPTNDPYITADERKMNESDMRIATTPISNILHRTYFNFLVRRVLPQRDWLCKIDRRVMQVLRPLGPLLGGRVLIAGTVAKP